MLSVKTDNHVYADGGSIVTDDYTFHSLFAGNFPKLRESVLSSVTKAIFLRETKMCNK